MNPAPAEIPPIPQTPSSPPIPPPPAGGTPKFPLFPILAGILLMILVATGTFFLGKSQNRPNTLSNPSTSSSPTSSPTIPLSPTIDPTADWKTYNNTLNNFSFKYPPTWTIDATNDQEKQNILIKLTKDDATITLYINLYGIGGVGRDYEGTPMTFNGKTVYEYKWIYPNNNTVSYGLTDELKNTLGVFRMNNQTHSIVLTYPQEYEKTNKSKEILTEFHQILQTFKFSDSTQAVDVSSWKTYSNSIYNISFQYPISTSGLSSQPRELNNPDAKQFIVTIDLPSSSFTLDIQQREETKNYLDNPPITTYAAKTFTWDIFITKTGYCDGAECGPPFVAYQMYKNGYRYVFTFHNQTEISELQKTIISSFQFI